MAYHLIVMLHVAAVRVEGAVSIKGHQLQALRRGVYLQSRIEVFIYLSRDICLSREGRQNYRSKS